jgi:hypothetical protein
MPMSLAGCLVRTTGAAVENTGDPIDCTIKLIPAARLLRCAYQSTAASASSSAAGWILRDSTLTAPAGREGRLRAALQETSSTVPSSICFSRSSISRYHASVAPSSTVASRLSIRESISAQPASGGKARASRSSSAGLLSMNRFYRVGTCGLDKAESKDYSS